MNRKKISKRLTKVALAVLLALLMLPMVTFAQADEKKVTTVSIASAPPSVIFNASTDELDKAVYQAMNIVVEDSELNNIDFTADEITLDYNRQVGKQTIKVTYKGNDQYQGSTATGSIIINKVPKKDTRLVLKANPPSVGYSSDPATLDKAVYEDLVISVVDSDSNLVAFSPSDITLTYNHTVGTQNVVVAYQGNDQYNPAQVNAAVQIVGKQDTKVSIAASPPAVAYTSDSAKMDLAVYQALSIVVVDAGNNKINFTAAEIDLSYNRAPGKQDVTVKYKGNDQYSSSSAKSYVEITGKIDPPVPAKENTSVNLSKTPAAVAYSSDSGKLDADIYQALAIQVVDSKNNAIKFTTTDIELSYNREGGDQPVTVKYKGTDQYNSSNATQTVTITQKVDCSLVITANPPNIEYDKNPSKLDDAVYKGLDIIVVDDNNNVIESKQSDFELNYTHEIGEQSVIVKYKGNNYFNSAVATVRVDIIKPRSNNLGLIAGIMGVIVVGLGVIGVVIYRKKHNA
ncbi:hypothetical protein [Acetobacterium woodii]|uniref:Uncharacterized protein n=1 Tax=Acetobacterium woodii (strain ATCC 29683 / DSM 1030 / JCM 2381 / KCTC 1655 / WB1) TaxID=931626 RepID=H6LH02_ACEWD|nr:hypothetical protein [Acetobacterium woodii]AFA47140.1 hypothetical protein Awo_c03360 [Acetobacterium woodii DSM 1030]